MRPSLPPIIMSPLSNLSEINFLSVCDVAMDIQEQLQMKDNDVVNIPFVRNIIRFSILLPAKAPNLMDDYYANRIRAVIYLKGVEAIIHYELRKEISWDGDIQIALKRKEFDRFYDNLSSIYQKRVVNPQKKQSGTTNNVPKFRFTEGILFRDFENGILKFLDEKDKEFTLISTAMSLPVGERIDTFNTEMEFRKMYDTARRLNEKIKEKFKIDKFFETDFANKYVKRLVE